MVPKKRSQSAMSSVDTSRKKIKEFDKKLMQSLKELEDKINSYEDSTQKYDALMAIEKIRQLLNLEEE